MIYILNYDFLVKYNNSYNTIDILFIVLYLYCLLHICGLLILIVLFDFIKIGPFCVSESSCSVKSGTFSI